MNPTITTKHLLELTKSADLLRQTAEKALRCDSLARELHHARNDRDYLASILETVALAFDQPSIVAPLDFAELPKAVENLVRENAAVKDAHHDMQGRKNLAEERANSAGLQVIALNQRVDELLRENETLARNVPPEPPADAAAKPDLVYVGQRWCRSGRTAPDYGVVLNYPEGWVVLCDSWMHRETGKLTDIPVPVIDLPEVSGV